LTRGGEGGEREEGEERGEGEGKGEGRGEGRKPGPIKLNRTKMVNFKKSIKLYGAWLLKIKISNPQGKTLGFLRIILNIQGVSDLGKVLEVINNILLVRKLRKNKGLAKKLVSSQKNLLRKIRLVGKKNIPQKKLTPQKNSAPPEKPKHTSLHKS
jgi:hypothetical protein